MVLLVLFPPVKLLWNVYSITDYRGGNAYVSSSPDGTYKGINMYAPESKTYYGLDAFLKEIVGPPNTTLGLADAKTGQMLAYVPIDNDALSNGIGGIWKCVDEKKGPCVNFQSSFRDYSLDLPPSRWQMLVAWTASKLRGLGASDFGKVEER